MAKSACACWEVSWRTAPLHKAKEVLQIWHAHAEAALQRATDFMGWRPNGESEVLDPKTSLCKVTIPSSGYMHMMESGKLECRKEGEWRLYGRLKVRETLMVRGVEVLLYEVGPELHEVI